MELSPLDWAIIAASFAISLGIGLYAARRAGSSAGEFFAGGRSMPWWLLGVSMVATTFAADTPNLVAQIVRDNGVAGNWVWWALLLTGMLTTFVYARLWRRSGVLTDLEFYELRYSGPVAGFLRGFRAVYLGLIFNGIVMATVCLAGIKLSAALLGLGATETLVLTGVITVAYSALGGLRGVILTDFFQFALALGGAIWAAIYIVGLPEIGGLSALVSHPAVVGKLGLLPDFDDPEVYVPLIVVPLAVQWWATWYPGGEPGGGGYVAQRMLAARTPGDALGATLLFNVAHYALRPWPWILIALASLVLYPTLPELVAEFPDLPDDQLKSDLGYPVMLRLLPAGLLGVVVASLIAALMSTLSTHLNWGASYLVHDAYVRFVRPEATQAERVWAGRICSVALMVVAGLMALALGSALESFNIILQIGAGTGLIFILRWLWWRVNAYSELAGMVVSFAVALYFTFVHERLGFAAIPDYQELLWNVAITTVGWLTATFATRPTEASVLVDFVERVRPPLVGWRGLASRVSTPLPPSPDPLGRQLASAALGVVTVYAMLFGVGELLYGQAVGYALLGVAVGAGLWLYALQRRVTRPV